MSQGKVISVPNLPSSQTGIVQHEGGVIRVTKGVKLPSLRPYNILVKTAAVALNPCDYKMPERFPSPGAIDGCDFAGTVVALGTDTSRTHMFKLGDRVFGAVHGSNPIDHESGSYAEYIRADAEFTLKIPDSMSFEVAASIGGTCPATLGLALFRSLGLPGTPEEPTRTPSDVLVYAGSTSVGTMACQLLKICGHRPIATCSPKNFDLVKSYGADKVFDYNSPTCAEDIKADTRNTLRYVLDPMTEAKTMRLCYGSMGRAGGKYTCLEMYQEHLHTRKTITPEFVMGAAIIGDEIALTQGYGSPADADKRVFGIKWYKSLQKLIDSGRLRPHPHRVLPGGFPAILDGIQMLKKRVISGQKLVVRVDQAA